MCGRYTIGAPADDILRHFGLVEDAREVYESLTPRYNVAPTQVVPVVRRQEGDGLRLLAPMRWGLVPAWSDDPKIGNRMINARAESAASSPAFRSAFKRRRCLVPATGFYEWSAPGELPFREKEREEQGRLGLEGDASRGRVSRSRGAGGKRQPWLLRRRDGGVFSFAGLWEVWNPKGQEGEDGPLVSFAIVTGPPNSLAGRIHDRMPVILRESSYEEWLDPATPAGRLRTLMSPYPEEEMDAHPVRTVVNDPRNEEPSCVEPITWP